MFKKNMADMARKRPSNLISLESKEFHFVI